MKNAKRIADVTIADSSVKEDVRIPRSGALELWVLELIVIS
jgi:hypothetical protein